MPAPCLQTPLLTLPHPRRPLMAMAHRHQRHPRWGASLTTKCRSRRELATPPVPVPTGWRERNTAGAPRPWQVAHQQQVALNRNDTMSVTAELYTTSSPHPRERVPIACGGQTTVPAGVPSTRPAGGSAGERRTGTGSAAARRRCHAAAAGRRCRQQQRCHLLGAHFALPVPVLATTTTTTTTTTYALQYRPAQQSHHHHRPHMAVVPDTCSVCTCTAAPCYVGDMCTAVLLLTSPADSHEGTHATRNTNARATATTETHLCRDDLEVVQQSPPTSAPRAAPGVASATEVVAAARGGDSGDKHGVARCSESTATVTVQALKSLFKC